MLYFSVGPDDDNIVTGASDETLRFWNINDINNSNNK